MKKYIFIYICVTLSLIVSIGLYNNVNTRPSHDGYINLESQLLKEFRSSDGTVKNELLEGSFRSDGIYNERPHTTKNDTLELSKFKSNTEQHNSPLIPFVGKNRIWDSKACITYSSDLERRFTTYVDIASSDLLSASDEVVTLLTQLSTNRIDSLKRLISVWNGPISAGIYATHDDIPRIARDMIQSLKSIGRTNVQLHLVEEQGSLYPVNYLRNVAQDHAKTRYVFLVDVDFLPMPNLYEHLLQYLPLFFKEHSGENNVLTIPALVVYNSSDFPSDKDQIKQSFDKTVFRFDYGFPKFKFDPTNFTRWVDTTDVYKIPFVFYFEPYFIIERKYSPKYSEIFLQRWYDKSSHVLNVAALCFQFWVYHDGYIVHIPHAKVKGSLVEETRECATKLMFGPYVNQMKALHKATCPKVPFKLSMKYQ